MYFLHSLHPLLPHTIFTLNKLNKLMAHLDSNAAPNDAIDAESKSDDKPSTVAHQISNVKITEIPNGKSKFVDPKRMHFEQNGNKRKWDLVESMGAVAALCYHADKKSFLFVKQFRAPVYYQRSKVFDLCIVALFLLDFSTFCGLQKGRNIGRR